MNKIAFLSPSRRFAHTACVVGLMCLLLAACNTFTPPWDEKSGAIIPQNRSQKTAAAREQWWHHFNDPLLDKLVDISQAQNIDIRIAEARLKEARALRGIAGAGFFPNINATTGVTRGNKNIPASETIAETGFDATWEIDLFGRIQSTVDAANARTQARAWEIEGVRNTLIADIARAVVEWRQATDTLNATNALLKVTDQQINLLNSRATAGLIDASFVERARAQRAQIATVLPQAEAARNTACYQLERLLNVRDNGVATLLQSASARSLTPPTLRDTLSIGITRLQLRPDVRVASENLAAAHADVAEAEANLFPKLSIASFFGVQEGTTDARLASNPIWSLASSVTTPVLNFGRLRDAVKASEARNQQALLAYENTINTALQETKTALSDYLQGMNSVTLQQVVQQKRIRTVDIAQKRFANGLTDMTDLTTAQTERDAAIITLITLKTNASLAYIRLQKALGVAVIPF